MKLPTFSCPHCGNALPTQNILQGRDANVARGRCQQCKKWIHFELPSVKKKLVYLDQSFLSAVCLEAEKATSGIVLPIFLKIKKLKDQQKIFVVLSDIHSRETAAIPGEYIKNRQKLWSFQNDLADGRISVSWYEVFVAQQRRLLLAQPSELALFPVTDIGLKNPHQWNVGMRIQLTNLWRQRLDVENAHSPDSTDRLHHQILDRQLATMPRCNDVHDCLTLVRGLWQKDIKQGIEGWQATSNLMQTLFYELESGRVPDLNRMLPEDTSFRQVVEQVVGKRNCAAQILRWQQLLNGDASNLCAAVRIRTAFEGELLWQWASKSKLPSPKKFSLRFGRSRQNDIDHISAFVPYVDALTTDNDMLDLCSHQIVASELTPFPCKLFANKNYAKFDLWLDELMAESHGLAL